MLLNSKFRDFGSKFGESRLRLINRFYMLRDKPNKAKLLFGHAKKHIAIYFIIAIYLVITLSLVKLIPSSGLLGGPDENVHYSYNVKYIAENHKLPISNVDDKDLYAQCNNPKANYVPCVYSYQAYIGANYFVSALVAEFSHIALGVNLLVGARLTSVLYGLTSIILLYFTARHIIKSYFVSAAIVGSVMLIPQVLFVFSYVNQDAHSIAIASFLLFTMVRLYRQQSTRNMLLFSLAIGGLLPLSKYNYFILAILPIILFSVMLKNKSLDMRKIGYILKWSVIMFIIFAGFWYARNIVLYNDALGQSFTIATMQGYHELGIQYPVFSLHSLASFTINGFFGMLFNSFYLSFGQMTYFAPNITYATVASALLVALLVYIHNALSASKRYRELLLMLLITLFILLALVIGNAYVNAALYDYQPQGRYLFPIIAPLVTFLALALKFQKKNLSIVYIFWFIEIYLLLAMASIIMRNYL